MKTKKPKQTLEEISESQFPPITPEWIKDYINKKDPYHFSSMLVKLSDEAFAKLTSAMDEALRLRSEERSSEIEIQLAENQQKLENLNNG